jgi:hypothetical protein
MTEEDFGFDGDMTEKKNLRSKKKNKSNGFQSFGIITNLQLSYKRIIHFRIICTDIQGSDETWL